MTNFEKIKQMTHIELAEFLSNHLLFDQIANEFCGDKCEHSDSNGRCTVSEEGCLKSDVVLLKQWLELEVK